MICVNFILQVKLETNNMNGPSRVVHLRSLPPDVTDAEVVQLGIPFGRMTNVLLLKQKGQVTYLYHRFTCDLHVCQRQSVRRPKQFNDLKYILWIHLHFRQKSKCSHFKKF